MKRKHRETDERHECDQSDAGPRQRGCERCSDDQGDDDEKHAGEVAEFGANESSYRTDAVVDADVLYGDGHLREQIQQVHHGEPGDQSSRRQRRDERPPDDEHPIGGAAVAVRDEPDVGRDGEAVHEHQQQAERNVGSKHPRAAIHEALQRESRCRAQAVNRDRLTLDRAGRSLGGEHHLDGAAFDDEHHHRSTEQHEAERRDERDERERLRQQRARDRREDFAQASLQNLGEVGAE